MAGQHLSLPHRQRGKAAVQLNAKTGSPGIADSCRSIQLQCCIKHLPQLIFILRHHDSHIRHLAQIREIEHPMVGRTVRAHQSGPIQAEHHRKVLQAHIVEHLVIGPLGKGGINSCHRPFSRRGYSSCQGDSMLFSNPHVKKALRVPLTEGLESRTSGHGCRNSQDIRILRRQLQHGIAEYLGIGRRLGALRLLFSRQGIEGAHAMESFRFDFRRQISLAFLGAHMDQHRSIQLGHLGKYLLHEADIVSVDGPHIGEAHLIKEPAGHQGSPHPFLDIARCLQHCISDLRDALQQPFQILFCPVILGRYPDAGKIF